MSRDIVREMCEDLLNRHKGRGEPFDSKIELYNEIGVPFSGTNPNSVNKESEEDAIPPRTNNETPIRNNMDRD